MKNIKIVILLLLISYTPLQAQKYKFGQKAGLNLSTFAGDQTNNDNVRTAFHVGAVMEYNLSDKFSIQSELLYSEQGVSDETQVDENTNIERTKKFNYLNLPVLAKYYLTENLSLEGGPQIGYLLKAEFETVTTTNTTNVGVVTNSVNEDLSKNSSDFDFGLALGIGYKLKSRINFAARYTLGLTNINNNNSSIDNQNRVFQLSVGYFFN